MGAVWVTVGWGWRICPGPGLGRSAPCDHRARRTFGCRKTVACGWAVVGLQASSAGDPASPWVSYCPDWLISPVLPELGVHRLRRGSGKPRLV